MAATGIGSASEPVELSVPGIGGSRVAVVVVDVLVVLVVVVVVVVVFVFVFSYSSVSEWKGTDQ